MRCIQVSASYSPACVSFPFRPAAPLFSATPSRSCLLFQRISLSNISFIFLVFTLFYSASNLFLPTRKVEHLGTLIDFWIFGDERTIFFWHAQLLKLYFFQKFKFNSFNCFFFSEMDLKFKSQETGRSIGFASHLRRHGATLANHLNYTRNEFISTLADCHQNLGIEGRASSPEKQFDEDGDEIEATATKIEVRFCLILRDFFWKFQSKIALNIFWQNCRVSALHW